MNTKEQTRPEDVAGDVFDISMKGCREFIYFGIMLVAIGLAFLWMWWKDYVSSFELVGWFRLGSWSVVLFGLVAVVGGLFPICLSVKWIIQGRRLIIASDRLQVTQRIGGQHRVVCQLPFSRIERIERIVFEGNKVVVLHLKEQDENSFGSTSPLGNTAGNQLFLNSLFNASNVQIGDMIQEKCDRLRHEKPDGND